MNSLNRLLKNPATKAYVIERIIDEACERDPVWFAKQLGFVPDEWQANLLTWTIKNQSKRLILNCARQTGKSTTAALLATHTAIYTKRSLILLVSPSLRQSGELFRKVRETMRLVRVPLQLAEDNLLSCKLENGSRIVSLPGTEKTVRGFSGATLIIEDEAARVDDEMNATIRPMLAVSGGAMIMMSTPFGKRGHFFKAWDSTDEGWEKIEVRADQCPRIPAEFLEQERKALGNWWFEQEYMCKFQDAVDSLFNYETIMAAISKDIKPLFGAV